MGLLRPELLLLLIPALWVWHSYRDPSRATQVVRLLALVLVIGALAAPYLRTQEDGRDLVVVLDRSLSMPAGSESGAEELLRLAAEARRAGDRLGLVSFGAQALIEALPHAKETPGRWQSSWQTSLDPGASNLSQALETALQLIPEGRQGSLLVISDGESNGPDVRDAARRAFARGLRIDVAPQARPALADLSVERLELPESVAVGEPFQFSVWVHADVAESSEFVLRRNGTEISRGRRDFTQGLNRILFRDLLGESGIASYSVELIHSTDRIPENNRGLGAVLATGTRPILVLNHDGREDTLVSALRRSKLQVDVMAPEDLRLTPTRLLSWRAVILENISAARLGAAGMQALEDFVIERGGGLLMTGGKASFGLGGYHLTPIDELLPVSMELRQEHRKQGVALVLVLDRSGSMSLPVAGGMTKMDLANSGSAAAIELLSGIDSVGVIAVDSTDHTIQELTPVEDVGSLVQRVRTIESMGGGIFTYTGLLAAANMLERAEHVNRHIILFADASDAEEPEGVPELLDALRARGTTVSVIALGSELDSDAEFLMDIADLGEGEIYFTTEAEELPRLFAQDTLMVARSSFIEESVGVRLLPDLFGLGEIEAEGFPSIEGYNLNYLKPRAIAGALTTDEYTAPLFSYAYQGIGRSAAYCGQVGGSFGGNITAWPGFASFFVTLARWLVGQEQPSELFASVQRQGTQAVISLELDPEAELPPDTSDLRARLRHPDGTYSEHLLERVSDLRYEARVSLEQAGVTLGTLRLAAGRFENLAPIVLPYSPEFERQVEPEAGERLLRELARMTAGEVSPAGHTLFRGERRAKVYRVISRELMLLALCLFLFEIAARRLALWGSLGRWPRRPDQRSGMREAPAPAKRATTPADQPEPAPRPSSPPVPGSGMPTRAARTGDVGSALEEARRRAGRKLDR